MVTHLTWDCITTLYLSFRIPYLFHLGIQLEDNNVRLYNSIRRVLSKAPKSYVLKAFRNSSLGYIAMGGKHHAYVWSEKKIISELCLLTPH